MIKKVTVINYLGESLEMPLDNPYESGFAICSIRGLGPVKANINVTDLATDDGSFFNSARALKRNITMSLKFFDSSQRTVEDVRQSSYRYFPLKKQLTLIIETDNRSAYCKGYVESNEPDIFSSDERCNISIICPDPWFYEYGDGEESRIIFNGIENLFEFPVENNIIDDPSNPLVWNLTQTSIGTLSRDNTKLHCDFRAGAPANRENTWKIFSTDSMFRPVFPAVTGNFLNDQALVFDIDIDPAYLVELILVATYGPDSSMLNVDMIYFDMGLSYEENHIEISSYEEGTSCHIYYAGDVELGFTARLKFSGSAENIVLYNVDTGESMVIATDRVTALTGSAIAAGDEIIIDTRQGLKAAQLLRNGIFYNILSALGRDTDWLTLTPGDNYLGYGAESGESNIAITISYRTAYEGV